MEGRARPLARLEGAFTLDAVEALRSISATTDDPLLLAYHPVARLNPFQALLYREAWDAGIAPVGMIRPDAIEELAALTLAGHRTALHLHWLSEVLADATSAGAADAAVGAYLEGLDRYRDAGGRIVWTIHNVLPHGTRFEDAEARLRAAVAVRAEVVHVLAERTAEYVAPWFRIPAGRMLHVPHPSYLGAYEDAVGRAQARYELGLLPDELVFAIVGAIRPYKGLDELLDAWDGLPADRPRRLLIAGAPSTEPGAEALVERAILHPTVVIHPRKIPASEMQLFHRAADLAVLPYTRSLNSGALLLALTFGLPVIVPSGGGLADAVDPAGGLTFDPAKPGSLREALLRADELATPAAREAASAAARAVEPVAISRQFSAGLAERLARAPAAAAR